MEITRKELINDLNNAYREQNDTSVLSDTELFEAWKKHGIHAGTWDIDEISISEE